MLQEIWGPVTIVAAIAGSGWYIKDVVAVKADVLAVDEKVVVAGSKADMALDRQMESLIAMIARLEQKPNKSQDDLAQLQYLRQQLEILRKARAGR